MEGRAAGRGGQGAAAMPGRAGRMASRAAGWQAGQQAPATPFSAPSGTHASHRLTLMSRRMRDCTQPSQTSKSSLLPATTSTCAARARGGAGSCGGEHACCSALQRVWPPKRRRIQQAACTPIQLSKHLQEVLEAFEERQRLQQAPPVSGPWPAAPQDLITHLVACGGSEGGKAEGREVRWGCVCETPASSACWQFCHRPAPPRVRSCRRPKSLQASRPRLHAACTSRCRPTGSHATEQPAPSSPAQRAPSSHPA